MRESGRVVAGDSWGLRQVEGGLWAKVEQHTLKGSSWAAGLTLVGEQWSEMQTGAGLL